MSEILFPGPQTIEVRLHYFALLREQRGTDTETVRTSALTVGELYDELRRVHSLTAERVGLKVAVNDEIVHWDRTLKAGDSIVFLPPFSGG